jgi:hypothetical protein
LRFYCIDGERSQAGIDASSTSRKSLDFAEMPELHREQLAFTPQRKSCEIILASQDQYDLEWDSVALQSSRSTRKRLQQKFKVVGTK